MKEKWGFQTFQEAPVRWTLVIILACKIVGLI